MKLNLKQIRDNLLGIHDSPHRIALGFGMGLFLGVLPGTGAIAAVVVALAIRANKVSALAGALLVNTWINIVAFPLALIIGAFFFRLDPKILGQEWKVLLSHFSWSSFLDTVVIHSALAVLVGYIVIGLALGLIGYAACYLIIKKAQKRAAIDHADKG